ncbi:MAG: hypothetical protein ACRD8Z_13985 [Nitrososphaeraceae archaeon]
MAVKHNINIRVLDSDFEGIYETGTNSSLSNKLRSEYGQDKVLMGTYLASEIPFKQIPQIIKEIVNDLRSV